MEWIEERKFARADKEGWLPVLLYHARLHPPHLRHKPNVNAGGVIFTTLQKFLPEEKGDRQPMLSDRRNIVVIADEAHRSQYDFIDGFALTSFRLSQLTVTPPQEGLAARGRVGPSENERLPN